jgi:hypothetical protein
LRQTATPYPLLVELARGAVNRVRTFVATLDAAGLKFPPEFHADLADTARRFGRLVLGSETDVAAACRLIDDAGILADRATDVLTQYRLAARSQVHGVLSTSLGCRLSRPLPAEHVQAFVESFHAVRLVPTWRSIEPVESAFDWSHLDPLVDWAITADLDVSIGPLIDLAAGPFPDWLSSWHGDVPNLAAFLSDFIATVVSRYRDRVRTWHVFAGFNHADSLGLAEDDRLRLAARTLEAANELDPKAERIIGLSQPFGEYLTQEEYTYSPLVFADTLLRAGLPITAIELELVTGAGKRGGERRDPLDAIHLFELYDALGKPLEVVIGPHNHDLLLTVLAAPNVRAILFDSWTPGDPCGLVPDAGLVDATGQRTPALQNANELRREWLT